MLLPTLVLWLIMPSIYDYVGPIPWGEPQQGNASCYKSKIVDIGSWNTTISLFLWQMHWWALFFSSPSSETLKLGHAMLQPQSRITFISSWNRLSWECFLEHFKSWTLQFKCQSYFSSLFPDHYFLPSSLPFIS